MITVKQVLVKARNLIRKKGFCKNKLHDSQGRHCMIGAVNSVLDKTYNTNVVAYVDLRVRSLNCLQDALPNSCGLVSSYNDKPGTRKKQAINVFNRAIKKLEE